MRNVPAYALQSVQTGLLRKLSLCKKAYLLCLFCAAAAIGASAANTLTTLTRFNGSDGKLPWNAPLAQGPDGNLYGTTNEGGINNYGTIFKITPSGTLTTLYKFCSRANCGDGNAPYAGLVLGTDGNFYGTTEGGGIQGLFGGTVFRITPAGALTTIHKFCSLTNCNDGWGPPAWCKALTEIFTGRPVMPGQTVEVLSLRSRLRAR